MQIQAIALQALAQAETGVSRAAQRLSHAAASSGDVVTLSAAAAELLQSKTQLAAAVSVAKTADELTRRTLDVLA